MLFRSQVRAPFDSRIVFVQPSNGMVGLVGPNGIYIGLAHMDLVSGLQAGGTVRAGQLLGTVSDVTSRPQWITVHLHLEVGIWKDGKREYSEPQRWMKAYHDYIVGSEECPLPWWWKEPYWAALDQFFPIERLPGQRHDPLVFDLDGDGVETLASQAGARFDHDRNGFAEQTGWVDSDDGFLVMDRNGDGIINDGRELFGDQKIGRASCRERV